MLFVHLLINYVILTLRNVKYQFNAKYSNDIITLCQINTQILKIWHKSFNKDRF